jgi:hypothetical protein
MQGGPPAEQFPRLVLLAFRQEIQPGGQFDLKYAIRAWRSEQPFDIEPTTTELIATYEQLCDDV